MDAAASSWIVVALALITANLPFFNEKVFALVALKQGKDGEARRKPFFLRLMEMLVLYFIVGAAAFGLEARLGNTFQQTWEFYAITGCLFLVLAFPGFVVRYLRKK
ncbi:DUF2818 family protein [Janthinobacterium agaricidamnosum]|uniref:Putative membrane protein n=1 Tax=Janthinobacterium agaricidamnosum NBRC 102515 = DSM 9628 TaxID=1349767 RepID=W0V9M4_9BURK|nr:DUF2818 family protein [Janthinobacterium agaricidamnosum]CDG83952.1 putative membrane protein [Janthinobacterium agaricidamnosum NBRC 102515 = DSM 9628]